jgi:multidrug efflux pump
MVISDLSIRRPVLATVFSLVIALVGIIAYNRIAVRQYPKTDNPVVSVETFYKGADAAIIESQITQVLEDALSGIEGIDYMTSNSRPEQSEITLIFKLNRDPDSAAADVRDHVSRVLAQLPQGIDPPVIQKVEADAQPFLYIALTSDRLSAMELSDYADRNIKDRLQNQPGVASVLMEPDRRPSMRIWLDPTRLAAYNMTTQDVENALRKQNLEIPAGRIESALREFTVLSETDLRTPAQFNNLVLGNEKGYLIRLSDVGRAEIAPFDTRGVARFDGKPALAIGVIKQATANPVEVSDAIHRQLVKIQATLPGDIKIAMSHDSAEYIRASISNVYKTLAEATVLVILIIFLFLRSFKATFIPLITIPLALLGSFALIYAFNFTINTLTLLALVLAIGLVVDDAIVMLENIYRHVESGMPAKEAAFKGSREIGFAIIAMTITLAAVYIPIGFMTGKTGKLFTEFAWTLAGAVLISGFVALTLSPMMCSKLIRHENKHGHLYNFFENIMTSIGEAYHRGLKRALTSRRTVVFTGIGIALCSLLLFKLLHAELAPTEDQGVIIGVFIGPQGASNDYMKSYAKRMEDIYRAVPEVTDYFVFTGYPDSTSGLSFAHLEPWGKRARKQQEIAAEMGKKMFAIPGILAFPINLPPLGQGALNQAVQLVIQTSDSYEKLQKMVDAVMARVASHPGLTNLDSDLKLNKPRLNISVNRDKLADLGISVDTVGRTLETLFGGRKVTKYKDRGKQYDVIVELTDQDRRNPGDLTRAYLRASNGEMVQLSNLVSVRETVAAKGLSHFNKLRSATITANLAPGHSLDEELTYLQGVAKEVLPASAQIDYTGQSREFRESNSGVYTTFALALIFIYLVLAAQFESFIHPFIIMLTVPLSLTGALLALYLSGGTLNIYSQVGLITLAGLITKHGILIVEFANQIRAEDKTVIDAVTESARLRLRPILMTTGAMVLSALPLALASGAGAESRHQMGWVIVGGLLVGTFFTLFVIPVAYSLIVGRSEKPGLLKGNPAKLREAS